MQAAAPRPATAEVRPAAVRERRLPTVEMAVQLRVTAVPAATLVPTTAALVGPIPVPWVALRTRRPRLPAIRVTAVAPAAAAVTEAPVAAPRAPRMAGRVVPPGMVRALPTAAPPATQGLVRQVPVLPPTEEPQRTAVPVVQVRAVALVVGTPARLVAVRAGQPRPVLAQALLVQVMPRVTRAAVLAVLGAAVPVVMLRALPRPVVPPRVAPGRAVLLPAVTAVPVVPPMPVLVRPVRVAQVRPPRPVARTVALAVPAVLLTAVPVVMLRVVPVRLVRPAPVVRVRAVRVVTPTLPAVPVRAGRAVTAPARVGTPLRVGSPRSAARRRPAQLLAPRAVTLRRTAEMPPGRPGTRPPRRVTVQLVGRVVTPGRVAPVPSAVRASLVAPAAPGVPLPPVAVGPVRLTTPASTPVQRLRRRVELAVATRRARRPGLRGITATRPGPARPTLAIRRPGSPRTGSAPMAVSTSAARISVWRTSGMATRAT